MEDAHSAIIGIPDQKETGGSKIISLGHSMSTQPPSESHSFQFPSNSFDVYTLNRDLRLGLSVEPFEWLNSPLI